MDEFVGTPDQMTNLVEVAPGIAVEDDILGVVHWIREYAPELDVLYLDPARFGYSINDPPYKIVERCNDGKVRVVMDCWCLDESVKQRIFTADTKRFDVQGTLEKQNATAKANRERRFKELAAETNDLIRHIIKNPKTTYTFKNTKDQLVRLEDDKGVTRRKDVS